MSEKLTQQNDLAPETMPGEGIDLAQEMAGAYASRIRYQMKLLGCTSQEAVETVKEENQPELRQWAEERPPEQVSWFDLADMTDAGETDRARALWNSVKVEALRERESGARAARVVESNARDSPIDRARYVAMLQLLREEWNPRPGTETTLVEMLAQILTTYERWMKHHTERITLAAYYLTAPERRAVEDGRNWALERVSDQESQEFSASMAMRWQNQYLRVVRALRDLRRYSPKSPTVNVVNANQVNVGTQQVNVSGSREGDS